MRIIKLTPDEAWIVANIITCPGDRSEILIAIDDIDDALKIKIGGSWTVPIGSAWK